MKKTLLDLDRIPTLEEMIEFFHDNDWTTAKIYGDDERTPEMNAEIQHIKGLIKEKYDALAKEMGRKKHPVCYSKDHPLMKLQDGSSEVVACAVEKLIEEHWDTCEEILNHFNYLTDPDIEEKADEMYEKAIKLMMQVQQYDKIAEVTNEKPSHEDYSNIQNNDPKKDFIKKWNQYSDKYDVLSYEDLDENEITEKTEEAEFNRQLLTEAAGEFWKLLTTDEKLIINYRISGWDYDEIANETGYKSHSAIVKKRKKIETRFRQFLEQEYNFT